MIAGIRYSNRMTWFGSQFVGNRQNNARIRKLNTYCPSQEWSFLLPIPIPIPITMPIQAGRWWHSLLFVAFLSYVVPPMKKVWWRVCFLWLDVVSLRWKQRKLFVKQLNWSVSLYQGCQTFLPTLNRYLMWEQNVINSYS